MKISTFNITELGYSHIKQNKVCQDFSLSYSDPSNSLHVIIVSDGHGSETYFRSDRGSKFACEIALEAIKKINDEKSFEDLFNKSAKVPARKEKTCSDDEPSIPMFDEVYDKVKGIDKKFEDLFRYIYYNWTEKVTIDWQQDPPTEEEKRLIRNNDIAKAYGATLIAYVRTPKYWYAFQIGDGKCLACSEQGVWSEPVLWDCECFLNRTTSLCEKEAYKNFRYSFSGLGDFPVATFIGTDGIDDSWGEKLSDYYTAILETIKLNGIDETKSLLKKTLPEMSRKGSRDDVSLAWIIDEEKINSLFEKDFELKQVETEAENIVDVIHENEIDKNKEEPEKIIKEEIEPKNQVEKVYKSEVYNTQEKEKQSNDLENNISELDQTSKKKVLNKLVYLIVVVLLVCASFIMGYKYGISTKKVENKMIERVSNAN